MATQPPYTPFDGVPEWMVKEDLAEVWQDMTELRRTVGRLEERHETYRHSAKARVSELRNVTYKRMGQITVYQANGCYRDASSAAQTFLRELHDALIELNRRL